MNFDVRNKVIQNISDLNIDELRELIDDSIKQAEEKLLPGLGVIFEQIWKNSSAGARNTMLDELTQYLDTNK